MVMMISIMIEVEDSLSWDRVWSRIVFVLQEIEGRDLATDIEFSRDLIGRMLLCDPQKRLTAEEAFGMSIFEDMVDPEEGQAVS